jgi:hypothetical protein
MVDLPIADRSINFVKCCRTSFELPVRREFGEVSILMLDVGS